MSQYCNNDSLFLPIPRAVNVLPNRFIGVVGMHEDFPVENMSVSHEQDLLLSCSHDSCVKFWDVRDVTKEKVTTKKKAKRLNKNKAIKKTGKGSDFFADLADPEEKKEDSDSDSDDEDEDSDEDSDDGPSPKKKQKTEEKSSADSGSLEARLAPAAEEEESDSEDSDEDEDGDGEVAEGAVTSDDGLSDEDEDGDSDAESDTGQEDE